MMPYGVIEPGNIVYGNSLWPEDTKPLPERLLNNDEWVSFCGIHQR